MEEEKNKPTTKNVTKVMDIIKETISLETVTMPVLTRLRKRVKQIQEFSQAKTRKIPRGNTYVFETIPPKVFISGLKATYSNGAAVITYSTYKQDGKGNKMLNSHKAVMPNSGKEYEVSANYILDTMIMETIEYGKAIKVEQMGIHQ